MSLSNWINQHSMLVAPLAAAGLVIGVMLILLRGGDDMSRYSYRYYYDLNTGEIIVDDSRQVPPIRSALGGDAVGAIMVGCGACDDRAAMKIGWLEKYTDEAKQMIQLGSSEGTQPLDQTSEARNSQISMERFHELMTTDHLLALPPEPGEQPQWVSQGFPEGQYVISQAMRKCPEDKRSRVCAVTEDDLP